MILLVAKSFHIYPVPYIKKILFSNLFYQRFNSVKFLIFYVTMDLKCVYNILDICAKVRHLTFFFKLVLISWMVTLSSCLIWQIISFIFPPNEYGCVYAWTTLGNIATLLLTILAKKKIIFSDEAHFNLGGYVNKQICRICGNWKPTRIHWKVDTPKTSHCLLRICVTVNGDCYRVMLNEFLFTEKKKRILATFDFNRTALRATQPELHPMPCFWRSHYQPQSWCCLVGHCRAAIWHRWTIICGVPSKISVTSIS